MKRVCRLLKSSSWFAAGFAAALAAAAPIAAQASDAITLDPGYTNFSNGGQYTLGFEFSPTQNISVTALGDYFQAGSTTTQMVGLWSAGGTLLASASVTGPGAATDGFDFTSITPLTLTAGDDYFVGGTTQTDNYAIYRPSGFGVGPSIDYIVHVETPGATLSFPNQQISDFNDFGGNFQYGASVPEPAAWAMLILGVAAIGFASRRRREGSAVAA